MSKVFKKVAHFTKNTFIVIISCPDFLTVDTKNEVSSQLFYSVGDYLEESLEKW